MTSTAIAASLGTAESTRVAVLARLGLGCPGHEGGRRSRTTVPANAISALLSGRDAATQIIRSSTVSRPRQPCERGPSDMSVV